MVDIAERLESFDQALMSNNTLPQCIQLAFHRRPRNFNAMKYSLIAAAVLSSAALWAQDLPQLSPKTTFEQRIGLTDAKVTYSRPSARGRDIFSEIVPPGEHWRLGANTKTLLTLSSEVNFEAGALPAGTYSLSLFPKDGEWVLVINKDLEGWGIYEYVEKKDALPSANSFSHLLT